MPLCRIFSNPDGTVQMLIPNRRLQLPNEPDAAFLHRIATKDGPNLPYRDVEDTGLPPRSERKQWKIDGDKVVSDKKK